jgi:hypothetical protein
MRHHFDERFCTENLRLVMCGTEQVHTHIHGLCILCPAVLRRNGHGSSVASTPDWLCERGPLLYRADSAPDSCHSNARYAENGERYMPSIAAMAEIPRLTSISQYHTDPVIGCSVCGRLL